MDTQSQTTNQKFGIIRAKIVLNSDDHAILKYDVLPAAFSSEISGRDMEAMKRPDLRIGRKDFRARMPSKILTKD